MGSVRIYVVDLPIIILIFGIVTCYKYFLYRQYIKRTEFTSYYKNYYNIIEILIFNEFKYATYLRANE